MEKSQGNLVLSGLRHVRMHRHVRSFAAQTMQQQGLLFLLAFVLLQVLACMPIREGGHVQKRREQKEVEPPPEPKWPRSTRQLRHEPASSSGHGASRGQSGYPGPLEASERAPHGQSGNLGPSGARFCGEVHGDAKEFRTFMGKLYLRTHGKYLRYCLEACHANTQPTPNRFD